MTFLCVLCVFFVSSASTPRGLVLSSLNNINIRWSIDGEKSALEETSHKTLFTPFE